MKKFLSKLAVFTGILIVLIIFGLLLPVTPKASKSLLMSSVNKDSLLQNVPSPRLLFVGGSNLSFGLDSKIIHDSLGIHPINTGITASLGLTFMMDNTLQYVKKGDIVILIPEYTLFYREVNYGSEDLLRIIFDANRSKISIFNTMQKVNLLPFVPKYAFSKFKPSNYINVTENEVYSVNSFNEFGDTYTHWDMEQKKFSPYEKITAPFNKEIIEEIKKFHQALNARGASLCVSYPGFQTASFNNSLEQIRKVEAELKKTDLVILGTPERYRMTDSMMFDTPYHLIRSGVEYRTRLFLEDFSKLNQNKR